MRNAAGMTAVTRRDRYANSELHSQECDEEESHKHRGNHEVSKGSLGVIPPPQQLGARSARGRPETKQRSLWFA